MDHWPSRTSDRQETVLPFAPTGADNQKIDQVDAAGRTILGLLHKAAGVAEENSRYALDQAQKLSQQLTAATARVAELESDVQYYRDRAERAEQWLHKIYTEIDEQLIKPADEQRRNVVRMVARR
jgi:hypothetical protein